MDRKALVGLLSGVTLVIATLIGVAVLNTPVTQGAASPLKAEATCAATHRTADAGYGVSRADGACLVK